MQHRIRSVEGENEWLKGMLRIVKQSAMATAGSGSNGALSIEDRTFPTDAGIRKAGVGAAEGRLLTGDSIAGVNVGSMKTPSESREAMTEPARRKGSPVGRAIRDSAI